jgi:hypothetical protein
MGLGKPNRKRPIWKKNSQRWERQSAIREKEQRLRNRYADEILHLNAEIRRSAQILMEIDQARKEGRPWDPQQRADALRIRNTATTRLGYVTARLQNR